MSDRLVCHVTSHFRYTPPDRLRTESPHFSFISRWQNYAIREGKDSKFYSVVYNRVLLAELEKKANILKTGMSWVSSTILSLFWSSVALLFMSSSKSAKKANILAFLQKSPNIGFFQIKSQIFDFKSKYWPFSTVLLTKL